MQPRADWLAWAQTLRRFKVDGLALWLLEAGSPIAVLGAQLLYIAQPLLGGKNLKSLAHMLEDEQETHAFLQYLRGESVI